MTVNPAYSLVAPAPGGISSITETPFGNPVAAPAGAGVTAAAAAGGGGGASGTGGDLAPPARDTGRRVMLDNSDARRPAVTSSAARSAWRSSSASACAGSGP